MQGRTRFGTRFYNFHNSVTKKKVDVFLNKFKRNKHQCRRERFQEWADPENGSDS